MGYPPVSIVVPTYNRCKVLKRVIKALLSLNYATYEIVIVNDNSTDSTLFLLAKVKKLLKGCKKIKLRIITLKKTCGPSTARNIGIKKASFDIIALLDDDCEVRPNWLKELVKILLTRNVDVVKNAYAVTHSCVMKKDIFKKVGYFDPRFCVGNSKYPYREDLDFELRIKKCGLKVYYYRKKLLNHLHPVPRTLKDKFRFIATVLVAHQLDVLLIKKHKDSLQLKQFLPLKMGFLIPPTFDYLKMVGYFKRPTKLNLAKIFQTNNSCFLFAIGIICTSLLIIFRFIGSLRYGKFII